MAGPSMEFLQPQAQAPRAGASFYAVSASAPLFAEKPGLGSGLPILQADLEGIPFDL
jgi:hypothetical protein